jgi:hypothetical protein
MSHSIGGKRRLTKAAATFIDQQLKVGRVCFPLSQLVTATGLKVDAAKAQLRRLGSRVVRVPPAQPFFLIVSPEHQASGGPPVEWWLDDYFAWLKHPYYLALQSAAAAVGASPQSIQVTQVMTDTPRKPIELGRLKIVFFVKRYIATTPNRQLLNAFAPMRVSTPAATAFDLVRYAARIGGIGRVAETLRPLLSQIREPDLKEMLESENETTSAQRLGFILEKADQSKLADVVAAWLSGRRKPVILMVPTSEGRPVAHLASRWRVVDNSGEFTP